MQTPKTRYDQRRLCQLLAQSHIAAAYAAVLRGDRPRAMELLADARRAMLRRDVWRALAHMEGAL